ncbi:glyoxalase superfamily protein [Gordonia hongkongensis]|uniref:Bleomycin resistance protein n=1 Tax=Gordonia hongkongensis TaxID=1701090 RepID=A0ABT6BYJ2_9ACTN|nr:glyoxalase superfamily protein [Gordonia hongkongensis]MDF6103083.1 bleomycin resistance family protein [Gordonia hongkongensis]
MRYSIDDVKAAAQTLRKELAAVKFAIGHSQALEIVSKQLGFADWNTASARLSGRGSSKTGPSVPILRIQDEALAREFYLDYLGFVVEWEHRFEENFPLYMRIVRDETIIDLSEHHGDGTPGTAVWVMVSSATDFHSEISNRGHRRVAPGIDTDGPGGPTVEVADPFGNVLRFGEGG